MVAFICRFFKNSNPEYVEHKALKSENRIAPKKILIWL